MGKTILACVVWAAVVACVGCVVEASVSAPSNGVAVSGPPPQPMVETRSAPPNPEAVWIAGYWHWTGMQYTWIPGHWEAAPPGARWRGPHYSPRQGTYFYEPGAWSTQRP